MVGNRGSGSLRTRLAEPRVEMRGVTVAGVVSAHHIKCAQGMLRSELLSCCGLRCAAAGETQWASGGRRKVGVEECAEENA